MNQPAQGGLKAMLKTLVQDYEWIHVTLGLFGNLFFFVGSVLFLPALEEWKIIGVWLFVFGSFLMLVAAIGRALLDLWEKD